MSQRTCLYDVHVALGAHMGPFGGFEMPIQYSGIVAEHQACRQGAVLFDTCHMGEFLVEGAGSVADLDQLVSCPVASLESGQCRYGLMCSPDGGVIDDLLVYRLDTERFMLVVNAGTQADDAAWIESHLGDTTTFTNLSADTAKIDLQGPAAPRIVQGLLGNVLGGLKYYRFVQTLYRGEPVLLSRTGYTGEIGVELYAAPDQAIAFWNEAMALGAEPAGLGARDTLRLEAGMPLHGHELTTERNAGEAGFARAIADDKTFIGSDVVCDAARRKQALAGIQLEGRRAARAGDALCDASGSDVGVVTSGSYGPSVGRAIALGYLDVGLTEPGTDLTVRMARGELGGQVVALPFWKKGTVRKRIEGFLKPR
ncbi:MAG: glycine cleavage system aminomethyltransferase GcvT [Kiritimatiellia bacterium]|jgi:aminomethyltransferase|nr:glycine cleavage system aminomethyltransferase GcvT [Kiritimatiellia bacterium]MDP6630728.1 glycine cleavage system aminomethyltransferase GcvT [Kiritimatiellia bacterium]MDP6809409.1 glycine cleavage system aminomethyltransferase GcvT [Kiritimatiellia bacterium]MDP7023914.1 glycine cleavage system aminomethyltransferase GcvT [Kiritimatiellia bacterium]